jgi:hypothetical protein
MSKVVVNIAGEESVSWPPFCVLCLKPKPEKSAEALTGHKLPYCQSCLDKIGRLTDWETSIGVYGASWAGFIIGLSYLGSVVHEKGWSGLLSLGIWEQALAAGIVGGVIVWLLLVVLITEFLISPILLRAFPSKVATWGIRIVKSKKRQKRTMVAPGVTEVKTVTEVEILRFTNPKYAEKFRKANGLGGRGRDVSRGENGSS